MMSTAASSLTTSSARPGVAGAEADALRRRAQGEVAEVEEGDAGQDGQEHEEHGVDAVHLGCPKSLNLCRSRAQMTSAMRTKGTYMPSGAGGATVVGAPVVPVGKEDGVMPTSLQ